nr:NAD kinase 2, mitochondrial-like [Mirounga angustirostris]
MTCYRGFLLGSCRRVAGGRAAVLRGPGAGGPAARPRLCGDGGGRRHLGQGQPRELAGCGSRPDGGFRPSRVVVVAKTTRYEFEQQRYRYAELSEEDLKQLVGPGGTPPSLLCVGSAPVHTQARPRLCGVARALGTTFSAPTP